MTKLEILAFAWHQFAGLTDDDFKTSAPYRKLKPYKKPTFK